MDGGYTMLERTSCEFDYIFDPKSVAIIGASQNDLATLALMNKKVKDRVFLVNPKYNEVLGKKCYPSILEVEDNIDYAVVGVATLVVPQVLNECIQKGVKVVQIYTAGFSETGIPERVELEKKIKEMAEGRIRIIGPNCFGVYCPRSGLSIIPEASLEEGHVGVIAQSGSVAESLSYFGKTKNINFSKVVSYGNAIDLDCADFLEYLADDPDTKIIALYVEGSKNGVRLKAALGKAASQKPVIAIKGGMTEHGKRAASSHTAAMAGNPEVWKSLFKQAGAIQVESFDELVNTIMAFDKSPLPEGNAVSIITNSGGFSVIQTDLCIKAGIEVPKFRQETIDELRKLIPIAGTSIGNPLDAWPIYYNVSSSSGNLTDVIKRVVSDGNIHSLVFQFDQFRYLRRVLGSRVGTHVQLIIDHMVEGCQYARNILGKPVMVCVSLDPYLEDEEERKYNLLIKRAFVDKGFPVYSTLDAAIKSLSNLYSFSARFRRE
jgi:acyl-CoA synthetase (NDP forming)